jgi:hypothetical protein
MNHDALIRWTDCKAKLYLSVSHSYLPQYSMFGLDELTQMLTVEIISGKLKSQRVLVGILQL